MPKSMTGFGAAAGVVDGIEYAVEIKTVNNRYLKISLRLPDALHALETRIEQILRKKLQRGSVFFQVRMRMASSVAAPAINIEVLQSYLDQLRVLEVETNPHLRLDLAGMMQLPGVCEPPATDQLVEASTEGLVALIDEALSKLLEMRVREGQAVVDDLTSHADVIEANLASVAARVDDVLMMYHEKLTARIGELTARAHVEINPEALAREVAIYAERSDIAEEVSRLTTHLKEFKAVCQKGGPMGRKLDFMTQEMLREANTIGSKSNDADIARVVVDIKTAIDRIKEQAANLE